MSKWEYFQIQARHYGPNALDGAEGVILRPDNQHLTFNVSGLYQTIAQLGADGWELVTILPPQILSARDGLYIITYWFKRPRS